MNGLVSAKWEEERHGMACLSGVIFEGKKFPKDITKLTLLCMAQWTVLQTCVGLALDLGKDSEDFELPLEDNSLKRAS